MSCYNFMSKFLNRTTQVENINIIEAEVNNLTTMPTSDTETILALKSLLNDKIEEIKLKEETITLLEKELDEKDAQIFYLKNEIDKFRQVVKPLTHKIMTKQINLDEPLDDFNGKKFPTQTSVEPRTKRQAISAEPIRNDGHQVHIVKIAKSQR